MHGSVADHSRRSLPLEFAFEFVTWSCECHTHRAEPRQLEMNSAQLRRVLITTNLCAPPRSRERRHRARCEQRVAHARRRVQKCRKWRPLLMLTAL
eukprot:6194253-Pleurochrysis_carterae.AAC.2